MERSSSQAFLNWLVVSVSPDTDSQSPLFWERLRRLFASSDERGEEPQRPFVIAVCVITSVVLWASLTLQEEKSVEIAVPTEIVNLPADQALAELPPERVQAQFRGPGIQLIWLLLNPPSITIDARESGVSLSEALNLSNDGDVRVESIRPQRIDLVKEPRTERRVPVRSRVRVDLPPAHELIRPPTVRPESVTVSGAESIVAGLRSWPTDSLRIDDLRDSVRTEVPLADTLTQLLRRDPSAVMFIAQAGKFAEAQREIDVEVTGVPSDRSLVALDPATIRVRYRILFDQLFESQRAEDFFATVSYSQIRTDTTGFVRPRVHVPTDMMIRDPEPIPQRLRYYTFVTE